MTQLKLYDRLRDEIVDVEPSTPGVLRVYSCGPTVYGRIHVGNARPYWTAMVLKRCERATARPARAARDQHHRRQRQDLHGGRASRACPSAQLADARWPRPTAPTPTRLGLGRPDVEPLASETIPEIIDLIERLIARGAAYASDDGDVYFSVEALPGLRRALGPAAGRADRRLARRARRGQALAARLRALEGRQARRGHRLAIALGRAGGRAGTSSARRWRARSSATDFDVHGGGLDLIFPHHENERAQSRGRRRALRARLDAQRHAAADRREDVEVARQHRAAAPRRSSASGRETLLMFFAQAHYRSADGVH